MKDVFYLETERLLLRRYTPEVMQQLFTQYNDQEIITYLGLASEEELSKEKLKFKGGYTTYRISFCGFHLIDKIEHHVIGLCGFHNWQAEHRRSEFGYHMMHESDKRKGFMKEAIASIIPYGFSEMDLHRIEAFANPQNTASVRLLEHFGFEKEGLLKQHFYKNGAFEDSAAYALFKPEDKIL
ncbi:MAG: GNAT family N-acetyltransferase [Bacteroidetes bacterium]|nr:GNAT family N-acetyltransferase [Bacteroidota bacterium]